MRNLKHVIGIGFCLNFLKQIQARAEEPLLLASQRENSTRNIFSFGIPLYNRSPSKNFKIEKCWDSVVFALIFSEFGYLTDFFYVLDFFYVFLKN